MANIFDLVQLITSETFVEFTLDVLETRLASLNDAAARLDYNPESMDRADLAYCLAKLCLCFSQRICGTNSTRKDTRMPQSTCYQLFFDSSTPIQTVRYVQLSQLIWRYFAATGGMDAELNCDRLVHDERAHYASESRCPFSVSCRSIDLKSLTPHQCVVLHEKSKAVVYWKLVANLLRTVKLHLPKKTPANQPLSEVAKTNRDNQRLCAANICNELLQLVSLVLTSRRHPVDILSLVDHKYKHELIQWLYDLASHELVSCANTAAIGLGCTIYKLISCLTAQSTTNAHLMKDLALDIYNCRGTNETKGTFSNQLYLICFQEMYFCFNFYRVLFCFVSIVFN